MQDPVSQWTIGLLWAVTTVFMAWTWIPAVRSALGKSRFVTHGDEETYDLDANGRERDEPEYVDWHDQLTALGFEPLGAGWLRVVDAGSRWMFQTNIRVFYSKSAQCYAMLQKEAPPLDLWFSASFVTCMTDGGMVLTANFAPPATVVHPMFISGGHNTLELAELLTYHDAVVANERREYDRRPEAVPAMETLLKTTEEFFDHVGRHRFRKEGQKYITSEGLIHLSVSLPAWVAFGADHWSLPLTNLIIYGALRLGEFAQNRTQAEQMKVQIRAHAAARIAARRAARDSQ